MSIWGKIIGGAAGFALGGPLGALLGAIAGHAVDRRIEQADEPEQQSLDDRSATRQIAFTIAVIVLGAKMAKADGVVSRAEVAAFKEVFQVPQSELRNVARIFDQAKEDPAGFEPYAKQIARLFRKDHPVLEELLDGLFHIAKADGNVHEAEIV
ncbi:MAG TPA: TerB family tellurite resistance protein, partial [Dongiaceae bacterium]